MPRSKKTKRRGHRRRSLRGGRKNKTLSPSQLNLELGSPTQQQQSDDAVAPRYVQIGEYETDWENMVDFKTEIYNYVRDKLDSDVDALERIHYQLLIEFSSSLTITRDTLYEDKDALLKYMKIYSDLFVDRDLKKYYADYIQYYSEDDLDIGKNIETDIIYLLSNTHQHKLWRNCLGKILFVVVIISQMDYIAYNSTLENYQKNINFLHQITDKIVLEELKKMPSKESLLFEILEHYSKFIAHDFILEKEISKMENIMSKLVKNREPWAKLLYNILIERIDSYIIFRLGQLNRLIKHKKDKIKNFLESLMFFTDVINEEEDIAAREPYRFVLFEVIDDSMDIISGRNKESTNKVLAKLNETQSNYAIEALKDLIQSSKKSTRRTSRK